MNDRAGITAARYEPLWPDLAGDARPPRSPQGSDAIHDRLIRVATQLFTAHGYRATTTRQIVAAAGTTERTLFKHFGSKAGIFEATIIEPFSELIRDWAQSFATYPPDHPLADAIETWAGELVAFVEVHRELLRMLIAAEFDGDETLKTVAERISAFFAAQLQRLADDAGSRFVSGRAYNVAEPRIALAGGVSMALGMVLLDSWLFARGTAPRGRDEVVGEIATMVMHGISARPPGTR